MDRIHKTVDLARRLAAIELEPVLRVIRRSYKDKSNNDKINKEKIDYKVNEKK